MKACEEYVALMMLSMDGEASQEELNALHAHLDECEACRILYESYMVVDAAVQATEEEPPEQLTAAIMRSIEHETTKKQPRQWLRRYRFTALAAVAAVIVLVSAKIGEGISFRADTTMASAAAEAAAEPAEAPQARFGAVAAQAETVEAAIPDAAAEAPMSAELKESGETAGGAVDTPEAKAELPAEASSAIFTDAQILAMEEAGFHGIAARTSDIDEAGLWSLFPDARSISLSTGETVYQVAADAVDAAVEAGSLQFFATYEPVETTPDPIYWIFLEY